MDLSAFDVIIILFFFFFFKWSFRILATISTLWLGKIALAQGKRTIKGKLGMEDEDDA